MLSVSSTTPSAKVVWSVSKEVTQPAKSSAPISNGVYKPLSEANLNHSLSGNMHNNASGSPPGLWIAISVGITVLVIGSLLTVMVSCNLLTCSYQ